MIDAMLILPCGLKFMRPPVCPGVRTHVKVAVWPTPMRYGIVYVLILATWHGFLHGDVVARGTRYYQ